MRRDSCRSVPSTYRPPASTTFAASSATVSRWAVYAASHAASYSSGVSTGSSPCALSSCTARNSALPPSMMSVPRPAMFVATVTAPRRPARATISASRAWFFAFSTSCLMPFLARRRERYSLFSTETVPTSTGCPVS